MRQNSHAWISFPMNSITWGVGLGMLTIALCGTTGWGRTWLGSTYQGFYTNSNETYNANIDLQYSIRDSGATLGHRFFRFVAGSGATFTLNGYTRDSYYEDGQTTYLFINPDSRTTGGYSNTGTVVFNEMLIGYYEGCDDSLHMILSLYNGTLKWNRNNTMHSITSTCYANDGTAYWSSASTLTSETGAVMTIADGGNNYYDGVITGNISFVKNGSGTQFFSNTGNSFSGTVSINGGTIGFYCNNAGNTTVTTLGTNSNLYMANGGEIFAYSGGEADRTHTLNKNININGSGSLRSGYKITLLVAGAVTGNTLRISSDSGYIALGNANNSLSRISIGNGTTNWGSSASAARLLVTNNNTLGNAVIEFSMFPSATAGNFLALQGYSAQISGLIADANNSTATVRNNSGTSESTLTINTAAGTSYSFAGTLVDGSSKALNLVKNGTGTQILANDNTYTGTTAINAGTLQIGNGGNGGNLGTGNTTIAQNALLLFNLSSDKTVSSKISGQGALTKSGTGTVTLTGANDYTGLTTINAGTLQIGNGGTTGSIGTGNVTVAQGATLAINHSSDETFANLVTGQGGVSKRGSGTLTLTGANDYSGLTSVIAGTLQIGDGGTTGSIGSGEVVISQDATLAINHSADETFENQISGAGNFTKLGTNTVTLVSANDYTGTTLISSGTLQIGDDSATGALGTGTIQIDSTLVLQNLASDRLTMSNQLTGSGRIVKRGDSRVVLNGADSTFTDGEVLINGGTLAVQTNLGTSSVTVDGCALELGPNGTVGDVLVKDGYVLVNGGTLDGDLTIQDLDGDESVISDGIVTGTVSISDASKLKVSGGDVNSIVNDGLLDILGGEIGTLTLNEGSVTQISLASADEGIDLDGLTLNNRAALVVNLDMDLITDEDYLLFTTADFLDGAAIASGKSFSSVTIYATNGTFTYSGDQVQQRVAVDTDAGTIMLHYSASTLVPEPSTWLLMVLGLLGFDYVRSQKKRSLNA